MAEILAHIGYDDEGLPALIFSKKINGDSKRAYIKLNDAWLFSEDHNDDFEEHIKKITRYLYHYFDMDYFVVSKSTEVRRMVDIASQVEAGIEQLLKTAPAVEDKRRELEFQAEINGQQFEGVINA